MLLFWLELPKFVMMTKTCLVLTGCLGPVLSASDILLGSAHGPTGKEALLTCFVSGFRFKLSPHVAEGSGLKGGTSQGLQVALGPVRLLL